MKLRDSFISIQHISNELNIPLASNECAAKSNEIFPSDYEMTTDGNNIPADSNTPQENTIIDSNIKIIDKATKAHGMRVRNLKKSMLNDNKLLRLRDKLLRRSKSTVGLSVRPELQQPTVTELHDGDTKEEYQNKENEQPKYNTIEYRMQMAPTPTKITSPNRNLVKMGTRVFSSQLLNKSFDNIFEPGAIDVFNFDDDFDDDRIMSASNTMRNRSRSKSRCSKRTTVDVVADDGTTDSSVNGKKYSSGSTDAERLSLRSTSLSSLYFSEKMSERLCDSPVANEAYVIRKYSLHKIQIVFYLAYHSTSLHNIDRQK